jgi:procollagen-lysine,2-oxoglutarate 5-dioxygenase
LLIHNAVEYHSDEVNKFVKKWGPGNLVVGYHSIELVDHTVDIKEWHVRNKGIEKCVKIKCDYLFVVDSEAHLNNPHALKLLIEQNRKFVAPMLIRPYAAWSNFWGMLSSDGFYARSPDYMDIVNNDRRGLWNVPFISSCYLIRGDVILDKQTRPNYVRNLLDPDMALCENLRRNEIFLYVSNRVNFGHLVNNEEFDTSHKNNELWEMKKNRWDWEQRYLHLNYSDSLQKNATILEPCPDVYWMPMFTSQFCDEFVDEAENFGKWSDGTNNDKRLEGGYEAVPTRDIHMNQIGYDAEWMYVLDFYVRPLQETVFIGYFHNPPRSTMNFMVRYRPDEQPSLRPHHDSSTYTINVALNTPNVDYEGGGCRFVRQDCTVKDTKKGWLLMHPGRLTHYHEGLTTTQGTRYIMISFVDP